MVSVLGGKYYEFPKPVKLEKRLKDYLEENVDEKYYLSDNFIKGMTTNSSPKYDRASRFNGAVHENVGEAIGWTIQTTAGSRPTDNYIKVEPVCLNSKVDGKQPSLQDRVYDSEAIATAVTTGFMPSVTEPSQKFVFDKFNKFVDKNGYVPEMFNPYNEQEITDESPTLSTQCGSTTSSATVLISKQMRIRKLTPLECWRLMGIDDTDFAKASQVCSNSQLYKQAGNGIVVDVFAEILRTMKEDE